MQNITLGSDRPDDTERHLGSVSCLTIADQFAFSAAGERLSSPGDNTIKIWNWTNGSLHTTLVGHNAGINDLAVEGEFLFSASTDNTVKIWNGSMVPSLNAARSENRVVKVQVDGQYLLSTSWDHTIKFGIGGSRKLSTPS